MLINLDRNKCVINNNNKHALQCVCMSVCVCLYCAYKSISAKLRRCLA